MKRIAVNAILGLALAACASGPLPEQPTEAEWVPCSGYGSYEVASSYARCIKHIAFLAETRPGGDQ
jgi:hypothetical protein